jgi:hypothetical protein
VEPVVVKRSRWVRAPSSGVLRNRVQLGDVVSRRQLLGHLADPTGEDEVTIEAPCAGVLIGRTEIPLLNEGDAAYHIATFDDSVDAEESVMHLQNELDPMGRPGPAGEPPIS